MSLKALTNARIIDCTGADPIENGSIIIEDDRIKEVLQGQPGSLPAGAQVFNCEGPQRHPGPDRLPCACGLRGC